MQIILSTNEDPVYVGFWKPVSYAYSKMFPECEINLAFLTNKTEDDPLIKDFEEFGKVHLFRPDDRFPEFGQAKMIRFILASQMEDEVCYIDDVDLFPLRKDFIMDKVNARPKDHLLCVGGEVYHNRGSYPASQMTAEGYIWKRIINPNDMNYEEMLTKWSREPKFDFRENIRLEPDFAKDSYFSDERLLRRLIHENPVEKFEMERGYENILDATLDRMDWKIDLDKLFKHGYVNAHCGRPANNEELKPLIEYIERRY